MCIYQFMGKKAEVFLHPALEYEIDFYEDNKYILSESYKDKNFRYHIDAAENYVQGIKKLGA